MKKKWAGIGAAIALSLGLVCGPVPGQANTLTEQINDVALTELQGKFVVKVRPIFKRGAYSDMNVVDENMLALGYSFCQIFADRGERDIVREIMVTGLSNNGTSIVMSRQDAIDFIGTTEEFLCPIDISGLSTDKPSPAPDNSKLLEVAFFEKVRPLWNKVRGFGGLPLQDVRNIDMYRMAESTCELLNANDVLHAGMSAKDRRNQVTNLRVMVAGEWQRPIMKKITFAEAKYLCPLMRSR
jgi:hypothetical protein